MSRLKTIAEKALEIAESTTDLGVMERAIQIDKTVREISEREVEKPWIRRSKDFGPTIANYIAVLAFLLSMSALIFQFYQFRKTIEQQEATFSRTQWREALKNISIRDDSAVLSSTLEIQSFFHEHDYAKQSRSLAIALLPLLGSGDQADPVWESMLDYTKNREDLLNLISTAQTVAAEQTMIFRRRLNIASHYMTKAQELEYLNFIESPEEYLNNNTPQAIDQNHSLRPSASSQEEKTSTENEYARDQQFDPLKRAVAAQWKINSMSEGFGFLWRQTNPKMDLSYLDLSGVILEGADFSHVDFTNAKLHGVIVNCNLSSAMFKGADLRGALIGRSNRFENSEWNGADWWDAELLSCELVGHLNNKYPAPAESKQQADELTRTCVK